MRRTLCLMLILVLAASVANAAGWQKFVAADKSFSFYYPEGFKSQSDGSIVELSNSETEEQLLIIALPYVAAETARQHGDKMLELLRGQMPDLVASNWVDEAAAAGCEVAYTDEGTAFRGQLLILNGEGNSVWFSYSAPTAGYSHGRALGLLQALVDSISEGTGATEPATTPPSTLEGKARAFLFVMEFALGFPFTVQQETLVLEELLKGWSEAPAEELAKYDAYPGLVQVIMQLDQKQVAEVQEELAGTVREWLDSSPQDDPVVAMVRQQLAEKGRTLVAGTPALTMMSARAYSELMGYAELLQEYPAASPDEVRPEVVSNIQAALVTEWPKLGKEQREQVRGTPGLWLVLRAALEQGTAADRAKVRGMLAKLAPKPAPVKPGAKPSATGKPATSTGDGKPMSMAAHWSMMQIQQQTFNHYMWSRGFRSTMFGY
ncbi:MAG: hypothetical protein ACYC63_21170 [Armatimonadota bacterium]